MKKYRIVFAEDAKQDLMMVRKYVTDISDEENAGIVIRRILRKIETLDIFPERTESFGKSRGGNMLLAIVCGRYRIIYIVNKQKKEVDILRVVNVERGDYEL